MTPEIRQGQLPILSGWYVSRRAYGEYGIFKKPGGRGVLVPCQEPSLTMTQIQTESFDFTKTVKSGKFRG